MNERAPQALAIAGMLLALTLAGLRGVARQERSTTGGPVTPAGYTPPDLSSRPLFIEPALLAEHLLRRRPDHVVVDLRDPAAYARFHLPGAINLSPQEAIDPARAATLRPDPDFEVVLYAEDERDPFDVAAELVRQGHGHVHVLAGGLTRFRAELLTPPSLSGVRNQSAARDAEGAFQVRRRFFLQGGAERRGAAQDPEQLTGPALVSTAWVEAHREGVVPVDVRPEADFLRGHLPGARSLPLDALRAQRDGVDEMLLEPRQLGELAAQAGLPADGALVVYAGAKLQDATLGALALTLAGYRRVAVLEGAWPAWQAEGRASEAGSAAPAAAQAPPQPDPGLAALLASTDDVVAAVRSRGATRLLDVRRPAEFMGEEGAVAARGGHVPGSENRELGRDLDGTYWRDAAALAADYADLKLAPDQEWIVYCRTGHRASATWFTLRVLLGHERVRVYDGSWLAWAVRSDLPVERGSRP